MVQGSVGPAELHRSPVLMPPLLFPVPPPPCPFAQFKNVHVSQTRSWGLTPEELNDLDEARFRVCCF